MSDDEDGVTDLFPNVQVGLVVAAIPCIIASVAAILWVFVSAVVGVIKGLIKLVIMIW